MRAILLVVTFLGIILNSNSFAQESITIAIVKYNGGGDWYANPSALPNLIKEVKLRTKIPIADTVATVSIMDNSLFQYPFIYITGHGDIKLSNNEKIRLRRYLIGGGFLWADDNYGLDKSFRKEMTALFPENPLVALPADHSIYTSFYTFTSLPKIHEHDGKPAEGLGITFDNRLVVFYSYSSDIGDGLEDLHVHNDGPELHELALRMGINILVWFFNHEK
jgi:hypothetical protein